MGAAPCATSAASGTCSPGRCSACCGGRRGRARPDRRLPGRAPDEPRRPRHGGLGPLGRAAALLTVAAPAIAAPFSWGAGAALAVVFCVVLVLLAVAMLGAAVLPPLPVVLVGAAPLAVVGVMASVTAAG